MATFKDTAGREWLLALDVWQLERVQARTSVRIDQLLKDACAGLAALFDDPVTFVRVLWVLVEEQAVKTGATPEQFARALAGDALEVASTAFMEAFADFCPSRQRGLIRALAAKATEVQEAQTAVALAAIAGMGAGSSAPPTNSPGSSGSIPPG